MNNIQNWTEKWLIKLNEIKSWYINFAYKNNITHVPIYLNSTIIPHVNTWYDPGYQVIMEKSNDRK